MQEGLGPGPGSSLGGTARATSWVCQAHGQWPVSKLASRRELQQSPGPGLLSAELPAHSQWQSCSDYCSTIRKNDSCPQPGPAVTAVYHDAQVVHLRVAQPAAVEQTEKWRSDLIWLTEGYRTVTLPFASLTCAGLPDERQRRQLGGPSRLLLPLGSLPLSRRRPTTRRRSSSSSPRPGLGWYHGRGRATY